MDIKVLRYFLALTKEESITAAANYLHLTQPTLSRQLSELEEELGTKLFIRGSRKITLTNEGVCLRKRAQEILELLHKTEIEFQNSAQNISGDIYIGSGETNSVKLLAKVIKNLQQDYPQIRVHITSGNVDEIRENIDKGLLDFGILIGAKNLSKYESIELPEINTWGILMRKDSPLAKLKSIQPKDLWNKPLIISRRKEVKDNLTRWLKKDDEKLNIVATYNLIFNAAILVEEGLGYAFSLDKLTNTTNNSPLCFSPLFPELCSDINIIWKRYQTFSKAAELFLIYLKKAFSEID